MPHGFAGSKPCTAITDVKYSGRITTRAVGGTKGCLQVFGFTPSPQKSLYLTIQRTMLKVEVVLDCTKHTKLFTTEQNLQLKRLLLFGRV